MCSHHCRTSFGPFTGLSGARMGPGCSAQHSPYGHRLNPGPYRLELPPCTPRVSRQPPSLSRPRNNREDCHELGYIPFDSTPLPCSSIVSSNKTFSAWPENAVTPPPPKPWSTGSCTTPRSSWWHRGRADRATFDGRVERTIRLAYSNIRPAMEPDYQVSPKGRAAEASTSEPTGRGSAERRPIDAQLAYWRQQLADCPTVDLPFDRPRPSVRSGRGAMLTISFPDGLRHEVDRLCSSHRVSPFMVLLALPRCARPSLHRHR